MTLFSSYESDLREMLAALDDNDVFAPGEREAWREGVEEAEHLSDLMMVNEALVEVLSGREKFDRFMAESDFNTESPVLL
ncbi:hypothetical protein ACFQJC_14435 [Haloferax namakaokahaiae]|uniref:Uncharacterized protein n=1 Tax=Haloferax namakaokahaiae TaxID=1748331 RepID=A0ABD5ZHE2_9EURY